jgi:hypothetical protein
MDESRIDMKKAPQDKHRLESLRLAGEILNAIGPIAQSRRPADVILALLRLECLILADTNEELAECFFRAAYNAQARVMDEERSKDPRRG